MKYYKTITLCCVVLISIFSCQKIEVPVPFNSFYPATIDGISYADSVVYFVDKADGEDFEINLKFSGGAGFKEVKIYNYGRNEITTRTDIQEVTESFSLQLPDQNSTNGMINVKGTMDHSKFYRGITAIDKDNYNISFYVFDKLGIYKTVGVKFRKP
jgi:hypothetical protein